MESAFGEIGTLLEIREHLADILRIDSATALISIHWQFWDLGTGFFEYLPLKNAKSCDFMNYRMCELLQRPKITLCSFGHL